MTKSVTLYDHTSEYLQIKQALEDDPDVDADAVNNLLSEISGQIEDKIRGTSAVIDEWPLEKAATETLRKRLQAREAAIDNRISRLKNWLLYNMQRMSVTRIDAIDHGLRVSIRNAPPRVVIDDEDAIPDTYKRTEVKISKADIKRYLNADEINEVPGARLEKGDPYVVIKT